MSADPRLVRPLWRGRTNLDALTIAALEYAEQLAGHEFTVTQGSYQAGAGDPNSAGTHDRGGVADLRWTGRVADVRALRRAGFAAWHRNPDQGPWPHHVHAVLIGHPYLAPAAARQVDAYMAGRDGLASNGPDDGPRLDPIPVFEWREDDMFTDKDRDRLERVERLLVELAGDEQARAELNMKRAKREVDDDAAKGEALDRIEGAR